MSEDQNIDQVVNGELCLLREAERERESDKSDTASKKKNTNAFVVGYQTRLKKYRLSHINHVLISL